MKKHRAKYFARELRTIQVRLRPIIKALEKEDDTEEIAEEIEQGQRNIGHASVALEQMSK